MSVLVQLRGGLGNQLFQYAAGYSLSVRLGVDLVLDTALLPPETVSLGGVRRWPEQISAFDHAGTFTDTSHGSRLRKRVYQSLAGRERSIGDSRIRGILPSGVYARETRDDVAAFESRHGRVRINAYCNSSRFFADQANAVSNQIRSVKTPSSWYTEQATELEESHPVALHLRWGDYLNLKHVYGTIPASYYRRGVELVDRLAGHSSPVWLFSDDPDGAMEYLKGTIEVHKVVTAPTDSSALENLLLLSRASGLVGANSSFSWWAAFLSRSTGGPVVFPRPLFGPSGPPEPKDWLQSEWIQIGRG
ncbi:MAG: alpha-1,2-fucosyltransferase [Galbitalea sp.]